MVQLIKYLQLVRKLTNEIDLTNYRFEKASEMKEFVARKLWLAYPKPSMITKNDVERVLNKYFKPMSQCSHCKKRIAVDRVVCSQCAKKIKDSI